ncbi:glycosyl hydrolase [Pseudobythopirellula maris]|uniref:glycosyl hydrolase n=1 Tax=Pseudobythopirellula maris TaxID=2527991 RepID=UPI0011B40FB0|nr:glycosyl hydrolase [Pseudobythopirellula maris]
MFTEAEGTRKAIGDVDVFYHEGLYHLFHLVLPNHDFIAHAVSTDAINWRRVNNALFIGDPGSWDDLMLWTMAVSPDPHVKGRWRMFYTGLSRREQGNIQRIGLAVSDDLYHWQKTPVDWTDHRGPNDPELVLKARELALEQPTSCRHAKIDPESNFPLEADPAYYESSLDEGREWVSFRDPYYYREGGRGWLIMAARMKEGPVVRRGCVGQMEETSPGKFTPQPALHHPGLYDDVEVPNLLKIEGEYYLIGSLREDAKIRYWHTDRIGSPWRSYHDNVLLAQGNYAGRICQDEHGWLMWNFFTLGGPDRTTHNMMPPPKRLVRTEGGLLRANTFEGLDRWVGERVETRCVRPLRQDASTDEHCSVDGNELDLSCEAGFQAFVFDGVMSSARLRAKIDLEGLGKCGLVFRVDPETHDGYYLSLDLLKGVAQLRAWRTGPPGSGEHMMQFQALQGGNWHVETPGEAEMQLIAFGNYLELSVDGRVILTLADGTFEEGCFGVYLESAKMRLHDVELRRMREPKQSTEHLVTG